MKDLKLDVFTSQALFEGVQSVTGVGTFSQLESFFVVPVRDPVTHEGYQRQPSRNRIRKLARSLSLGEAHLPLSVLLSTRGTGSLEMRNGSTDVLRLDNNSKLFVVDGQHRLQAIAQLSKDEPEHWSNFKISFVCIVGASESQEARLFLEINQKSQRLKVDLAASLLADRPISEIPFAERVSHDRMMNGQIVAERLSGESPLWIGRIALAGTPLKGKTIGNFAMGDSLQNWLKYAETHDIDLDTTYLILNAYWTAISQVLPECFTKPEKFGIQQQTGVRVLHNLLLDIAPLIVSAKKNLKSATSYRTYLERVLLGFEFQRPDGSVVSGSEFWLRGALGGAGTFSSGAGQSNLLAQFKRRLT